MATYSSGNATRLKILTTARQLFYKNDFENTTYAQIAKKANVNIGTIVYHFDSLNGIANQIYQEIVYDRAAAVKKKIKQKFSDHKYLKSTLDLAQYRINTQSYLDYPNYAKFVSEQVFRSEAWENDFFDYSTDSLCKDYGIDLKQPDFTLHRYLFLPYASVTAISNNEGIINATAKEICDYQFTIRLASLGISKDDINKALIDVDAIASKIRLIVNNQMKISAKYISD